jgi:tetratricopeptide (TPR) repeat protein
MGFVDDILTLRDYSFIVPNEDRMSFEMHRLVQLAMLEWLEANGQQEHWRYQLLQRFCAELPNGEYENWPACQRLFPHAQCVAIWAPKAPESLREWGIILYKAAWFALKVGKWKEAETLSSRALKARKKVLKADDKDVINVLAILASVYSTRGRWPAAEKLKMQVMEIRKTKLGADHPDTLTSMNNLAFTWKAQGRNLEACNLLRKCVELRRQKLGPNHPHFLYSFIALAQWEKKQREDNDDQRQYDEVKRVNLNIRRPQNKTAGETLPNTLQSMASVAVIYGAQRRIDETENIVSSTAAFSLD